MISKIVFFGDSITAASKDQHPPLGNGYVAMLKDLFASDSDLNQIKFMNAGISGHTIDDLLRRYKTDILPHQPDAIVIKIGINDARKDSSSARDRDRVKHYETGLQHLIITLQNDLPGVQLFLFTPYYISDSTSDPLYCIMGEYCGVVKALADKFAIPVLDTQAVFDAAVKMKPAREWAPDQIHPEREGHMLIARAAFPFLKGHLIKGDSQ